MDFADIPTFAEFLICEFLELDMYIHIYLELR